MRILKSTRERWEQEAQDYAANMLEVRPRIERETMLKDARRSRRSRAAARKAANPQHFGKSAGERFFRQWMRCKIYFMLCWIFHN